VHRRHSFLFYEDRAGQFSILSVMDATLDFMNLRPCFVHATAPKAMHIPTAIHTHGLIMHLGSGFLKNIGFLLSFFVGFIFSAFSEIIYFSRKLHFLPTRVEKTRLLLIFI
jgi:hypothetical protein